MINSKFDLSIKLALITGAAGLLGYEHAYALLESNCNIIITDIDFKRLINLKQNLSHQFPKCEIYIYEMDVTNFESINSVQKELLEKNLCGPTISTSTTRTRKRRSCGRCWRRAD